MVMTGFGSYCQGCRKRGYFTKGAAKAAMARTARYLGIDYRGHAYRGHAYRCPHGGGWHFGRQARLARPAP